MRVCRVVCGLALAAAAGCAAGPAGDPPSPPTVVAAPVPPATVVGAVGCDARGCHGELSGTAPAGQPYREAATRWRAWDRHHRAFDVLREERSAAIIAHLRQGDSGWQEAPAEPRCLACHATPAAAARTDPEARAVHADGVGCEACHTAPGRATGEWLTAHWQPGGVAASYAGGALRKLGTATDRAAACVGCHVGAAAADGVPAREVTHDLIAAGHPRLAFELLTYLELMPPHWPAKRDAEPKPVAWQAGQVEAARAALTLAAGRGPGAELADRNCYACHHRLAPGRPPVGWSSPLVSDPLQRLLGWGEAERATLAACDPAGLWRLRDRLTPEPIDAARLTAAVGAGERDWDAAAQGYYALRAAGRPAEPLARLAERLRLPRGPTVANSPVGYDPAAVAGLLAEATGR